MTSPWDKINIHEDDYWEDKWEDDDIDDMSESPIIEVDYEDAADND